MRTYETYKYFITILRGFLFNSRVGVTHLKWGNAQAKEEFSVEEGGGGGGLRLPCNGDQ